MGIKHLPKILRQAKVRMNNLFELAGKSLGVDVSVILHKMISCATFASAFFQLPPIDLSDYLGRYFKRLITFFKHCKVDVIYVFDARSNPLKKEEEDQRSRVLEENRIKIAELSVIGQESDLEEIKRLQSASTYVREDLIRNAIDYLSDNNEMYISAAFEADQQLIQLELEGHTDGTISIDSDIIILGSKLLVDN